MGGSTSAEPLGLHNKMKFYNIIIFALFSVSQSLTAGNAIQCNLSLHEINDGGKINKKPFLYREHVKSINNLGIDEPSGLNLIAVKLTLEGAIINKKYTTENIGKYIAIQCDGALVSKARIMSVSEDEFLFTTNYLTP